MWKNFYLMTLTLLYIVEKEKKILKTYTKMKI